MSLPVWNLHNHTPFSDGAYTIDELCEAHLDASTPFAGIGISDHLFCTPSSREVTSEREFERLFVGEVRDYVASVEDARRRWAGKLEILCGAEINWPLNRNMTDVIRRNLTGIDYVLVKCVDWAGLTQLAHQARKWPCRLALARTSIRSQFPNTSMDQVVRTLANARILYEVNTALYPFRGDDRWFGILDKHRIQLIIGTDTHDDLRVLDAIPEIVDYLERRQLTAKLWDVTTREPSALPAAS